MLSDFEKYSHKNFSNSLGDLLPLKLIPLVIELSGISEFKKVYDITKEERRKLVFSIKHFPISLRDLAPIEQAIITSGGVSVKELEPSTMESKLVSGVYFAGEILDVDALTGGFNLQIAFATGRAAGIAAAEEVTM